MSNFSLSELFEFDDIVVQCHDFPDADAVASSFAVYTYLTQQGKRARLVYSGAKITKANMVRMVESLAIPIEHVKDMPGVGVLVTADCQHGERNVSRFDAETVFVIDHHQDAGHGHRGIINSRLGSCSTLVWDLLRKEQFDLGAHPNVATALYYGLYTDTNSLEEISHPLDKDMRDSLPFERNIIDALRFNNITSTELGIAGAALTRYRIDQDYSFAVFRADACDQNILGFISDLALQVEGADVCVAYNPLPDGYKLSIRSCTREVMANEFAAYLAGGGGHKQKAGGYISKAKIGDVSIDDYIENRTREYFDSYTIIDAKSHDLDIASMSKYQKLKIPVGFVRTVDVFEKGTPITIRTLEGDTEAIASDEIYIMVGILGEAYPINAEKFAKSYLFTDLPFCQTAEYTPTAINKLTGESALLGPHINACVAKGEVAIYATPATKNIKVFTAWNPDSYMCGSADDFIAVRTDDHNDVYIVKASIFKQTYERIE